MQKKNSSNKLIKWEDYKLKMNENKQQFAYILSRYPFYEGHTILMVSASCDEIITYFTREMRKLPNGYGLQVECFEFGKLYEKGYGKSIRHIEREDGKIRDLKEMRMDD